ncbi:hypothetical protein HX004_06495 [Myroides sp. 1354]|uniref:hypothetical protein n=1 Tax=unclassified Myroides TaxID=2642485 RepID=UPI0025752A3A|nr:MULTISPECIES: hypothetical protein [unclassified Myroides]MDM1044711.1 hypothetical protein [Myroides sp. R163-1]MDM1055424.1 hypothetical protein [Myroides sp. 1354]MDM1068721.1 hypothetical protein [Myroides sp. 1372]
MKKFALLLLCLAFVPVKAQKSASCDIPISTYISQQMENLPVTVQQQFSTKIKHIAATEGFGSNGEYAQFFVYPEVTVTAKNILPGPPTSVVLELDVALFVEDVYEGKIYTSTSFTLKGVGQNETKAYVNAIKKLNNQTAGVKDFFQKSHTLIAQYYNENYANIIKKATNLANQKNFSESLYLLTLIPECTVGYQEALKATENIYQKYVDQQCNENYAKALASWNATQNSEGGKEAGAFLAQIEPSSICYEKAIALFAEIKAKVREDQAYEIKKSEEEMKLLEKRHENEILLRKAQQEAYKEIAIAYAKSISKK